jgi:hypothetical protein
MGAFTINLLACPIKLDDMGVGVIEFANKKRSTEFSKLDEILTELIAQ